jgi:hypothetical protein
VREKDYGGGNRSGMSDTSHKDFVWRWKYGPRRVRIRWSGHPRWQLGSGRLKSSLLWIKLNLSPATRAINRAAYPGFSERNLLIAACALRSEFLGSHENDTGVSCYDFLKNAKIKKKRRMMTTKMPTALSHELVQ